MITVSFQAVKAAIANPVNAMSDRVWKLKIRFSDIRASVELVQRTPSEVPDAGVARVISKFHFHQTMRLPVRAETKKDRKGTISLVVTRVLPLDISPGVRFVAAVEMRSLVYPVHSKKTTENFDSSRIVHTR